MPWFKVVSTGGFVSHVQKDAYTPHAQVPSQPFLSFQGEAQNDKIYGHCNVHLMIVYSTAV
jgi:hypothetical protein